MGARQSIQGDIDRRPRSNSTIETGVEVHGGSAGRSRPISHYQRETSSASDLDDDSENVTAGLAGLGISSALSSSTFSSPTTVVDGRNSNGLSGLASGSAPSSSSSATNHNHGHHHYRHGNQTGGHASSSGLRPTNRTTFLQALAGGSAASTSAGVHSSSPSSSAGSGGRTSRHSVPLLHLIGRDIKCPICHKKVCSDDVEVHLVMCFTRPKIAYNDDVLETDKGECAICLEDMSCGETIARLPCLCIYHKHCIDEWFKRKNSCPEHPGEDD